MPIVRRDIQKQKWETPETMIREFIDGYELILEGTPNQIIYGFSFPFQSPDSLFVYRGRAVGGDETLWLYKNANYLKVYPYRIGTIVPFFGNAGGRNQTNVAYATQPNARPWALCDGGIYNGVQTPNMLGRGFVGFLSTDSAAPEASAAYLHGDISAPKKYAGADLCQLKTVHLPIHYHDYANPTDISAGGQATLYWKKRHERSCGKGCTDVWYEDIPHPNNNSAQEKNTVVRYTSSVDGWDGTVTTYGGVIRQVVHNNLPPYIVLNWKMYVGY